MERAKYLFLVTQSLVKLFFRTLGEKISKTLKVGEH